MLIRRPGFVVHASCGFALSLICTVRAEHFNILMIGNSYTQGNSTARAVSLDLQGLFNADSVIGASVTVRADDSASLEDHAYNPLTQSMITSDTNMWDIIVLQDRSDLPAFAMKFGDFDLDSLDDGGPALIRDYIKPYQPQAKVVLFSTWARAVDEELLSDYFDNSPSEMLEFSRQGYDRVRKNAPNWDFSDITTIAPIGDAWNDWSQTYGYSDTIGLYRPDGSHQNNRGSYLAAAVLFETITGRNVVGNTYSGGVTGRFTGVNQVLLLQNEATKITGVPEPLSQSQLFCAVLVVGVYYLCNLRARQFNDSRFQRRVTG